MLTFYTKEFTWNKKRRQFEANASELRGDWEYGFDIKSPTTKIFNHFRPSGDDYEGNTLIANNFHNATTGINVKIFVDTEEDA